MSSIYIPLGIIVGFLAISIGSSQGSFISLALLASLVVFMVARLKNSRPWVFALIASTLWAAEELLWAIFRLSNNSNILITDILYFSGAFFWLLALILMQPKMRPDKRFIVSLPIIFLALWLSMQSWSAENNLSLIVELLLLFVSLPLVFASLQGKAHEGRILWSFGFYIRVIAVALLGLLGPASGSEQLFFTLFSLSYGFIIIGIYLELSKSQNRMLAIGYSVVGIELLLAIIMVLIYRIGNINSLNTSIVIITFAYLLLIAVLAFVYSDRKKRVLAETQLKNYNNLLEHILSYKTEELNSNFKYEELEQGLFKITKTSFPQLTGLKIINISGKDSIFGQTEERGIQLIADDEIVGRLYFQEKPDNLHLLENIAPLLGRYIKTTLSHFSSQTQAITDPLTNVLNRRGFEIESRLLLKQAQKQQLPVTIALIDVDHFKTINDQYGHDIGDQALKTFCNIIERNIRSFDLIVRWGGEEFLLVLLNADIDKSKAIIERIDSDLKSTNFIGISKPPSFSAGISGGEIPDTLNIENLLNRADQAMYIAKNTGRDKHVVLN